MVDLDNRTDFQINIMLLEKIASSLTQREIELIVTDNSEIQQINNDFRNIDKPTDVLSFPLEEVAGSPLGSIVISADYINEKSKEYDHSFDEESALLFIHGLLHLMGYDHEVDNGEHRKKEKEIIKQFNLPDSLIIRND